MPSHIISCDDYTEGFQEKLESEIGLVSRASLNTKSTNSTYHHDNSNKMKGRRVRHHVIRNGAGDTAATCITIYLTDAEMPGDEDFKVLRVQGLGPGGYGLNGSKEMGFVLLMKATEGAEKRRFRWIRKNILFPFIDKIREMYSDFDASSGARPIGEELTVVVWCDGDNSQLDTVTSEEGIALYVEKT